MKKNKNIKGFTLIEILAVIIILGILLIIAVPAVTKYIENSRRESYIDTAKQIIAGARNYVNDSDLDLYDNEATYYMPISCIQYENGAESINGNFTLAYVGIVYKEDGFNYYWTSVDEEGEGISKLTGYDDLDVDKIESGISLSDIDTSLAVGGTIKTIIFNNDCTETQESEGYTFVYFNANGGEFSNGESTNIIKYKLPVDIKDNAKVSYTENLNDDGNKISDYGNNWTNANIRGTDRGDISKAHVITIPGATALHVKITFGGESVSWDWACMWQGSYPDYTAVSNCGSSLTGKLGGGSHTAAANTKEYDVSGNTVTFAYRSDSSVVGDGYGYYAVVTDKSTQNNSFDKGYDGVYLEPTRDGYIFEGWEYNGTVYKSFKELKPTDSITYKAKWKEGNTLRIVPNGGYVYINGTAISSQTDYKMAAGSSLTYSNPYRNSNTYSSGSYTTTFNSNGGSTTPSSVTSTRYYTYSYSFNKWQLVGDCDNFASETNTSGTYVFPESAGDFCTVTPQWNSSYSGYYAYSFTLPAAPTREGYVFKGWKSSANNQVYAAGASYTPTGNHTLTAQWVELCATTVDYPSCVNNCSTTNTKTCTHKYYDSNQTDHFCSTGTSYNVDCQSICRRATTLHTTTCNRNDGVGCNNVMSYNAQIQYGSLGTNGVLRSGDAFDCDVNSDGVYDPVTERFYYVTSDASNPSNAVLIYYTSVTNGSPDRINHHYYDSSNNYNGPRVVYQHLPSTSQWNNDKIIAPGTRQIYNDKGGTTTGNGSYTLPRFTYTNKAARLLTAEEMRTACGSGRSSQIGYMDGKCEYLIENTSYEDSSFVHDISFETVNDYSTSHYDGIQAIHRIEANALIVWLSSEGSARPVITVSKTDMDY